MAASEAAVVVAAAVNSPELRREDWDSLEAAVEEEGLGYHIGLVCATFAGVVDPCLDSISCKSDSFAKVTMDGNLD